MILGANFGGASNPSGLAWRVGLRKRMLLRREEDIIMIAF
jgi:hypothetical protein